MRKSAAVVTHAVRTSDHEVLVYVLVEGEADAYTVTRDPTPPSTLGLEERIWADLELEDVSCVLHAALAVFKPS